jgi:hypothetical protein
MPLFGQAFARVPIKSRLFNSLFCLPASFCQHIRLVETKFKRKVKLDKGEVED